MLDRGSRSRGCGALECVEAGWARRWRRGILIRVTCPAGRNEAVVAGGVRSKAPRPIGGRG